MSTFALNYQDLWEIDITPSESTETWVRLAAGITGADPSSNENLAQDTYLDGDGWGSTEVIGAQKTISFSGHRVIGDAAQDYIASLQHVLGATRKTSMRYTDAQGNMTAKDCTIANVDFGGGDAGAKQDISFEIHLNGRPEDTAKSAATTLTATVAAGSVSGTTKFTATAAAGNSLRYKLKVTSVGTVYGGAYLEDGESYTSANDIPATAGQFLAMYEVSAFGRVVKFSEHTLLTADIMA